LKVVNYFSLNKRVYYFARKPPTAIELASFFAQAFDVHGGSSVGGRMDAQEPTLREQESG
jgi:hypothetical protein